MRFDAPPIPTPDDLLLQGLTHLGVNGLIVAGIALLFVGSAWFGVLRAGTRVATRITVAAGRWLPGRVAALIVHLAFAVPYVVLGHMAFSIVLHSLTDGQDEGIGWYVVESPSDVPRVLGFADIEFAQVFVLCFHLMVPLAGHVARMFKEYIDRFIALLVGWISSVVLHLMATMLCCGAAGLALGFWVVDAYGQEAAWIDTADHPQAAAVGWLAVSAVALLLAVLPILVGLSGRLVHEPES